MVDPDQLPTLLRVLSTQAQQRGELARRDDLPTSYWYDVQFGYDDAIKRLEALLRDDADALTDAKPTAVYPIGDGSCFSFGKDAIGHEIGVVYLLQREPHYT